ncbi:DASH complex subunit ask1 [Puccinia graminis f. sp. tritici]|uniref:DASH complex subunit ask1 n=1 Tax=Puccinia graminis f. sp. tritici TaxID=56615 RepID=A0A5B0NKN3_PUCGR|nr:DASH complex subunit ask1 [Puccinia graminis f. sp. tritici]
MAMDDSMDSPPDSPTLFGIHRDSKLPLRPTQDSVPADPPRPHNSRPAGSQTFVPMRPIEIDTLFGGNLMESKAIGLGYPWGYPDTRQVWGEKRPSAAKSVPPGGYPLTLGGIRQRIAGIRNGYPATISSCDVC